MHVGCVHIQQLMIIFFCREMLVNDSNNCDGVDNDEEEHETPNEIQKSKRLKLSASTNLVEPIDKDTLHSKTSERNEPIENETNILTEESIERNHQSLDGENGVEHTSSSSFTEGKLIQQNGISNKIGNDEESEELFHLFHDEVK